MLLVTHDMGVIAETADRVAVMYAGRLVEIGPVAGVLGAPGHPYARGLTASIPSIRRRSATLPQIAGNMPRLDALPPGCAFHPRCPERVARCTLEQPDMRRHAATSVACWLARDTAVEAAIADQELARNAGS